MKRLRNFMLDIFTADSIAGEHNMVYKTKGGSKRPGGSDKDFDVNRFISKYDEALKKKGDAEYAQFNASKGKDYYSLKRAYDAYKELSVSDNDISGDDKLARWGKNALLAMKKKHPSLYKKASSPKSYEQAQKEYAEKRRKAAQSAIAGGVQQLEHFDAVRVAMNNTHKSYAQIAAENAEAAAANAQPPSADFDEVLAEIDTLIEKGGVEQFETPVPLAPVAPKKKPTQTVEKTREYSKLADELRDPELFPDDKKALILEFVAKVIVKKSGRIATKKPNDDYVYATVHFEVAGEEYDFYDLENKIPADEYFAGWAEVEDSTYKRTTARASKKLSKQIREGLQPIRASLGSYMTNLAYTLENREKLEDIPKWEEFDHSEYFA